MPSGMRRALLACLEGGWRRHVGARRSDTERFIHIAGFCRCDDRSGGARPRPPPPPPADPLASAVVVRGDECVFLDQSVFDGKFHLSHVLSGQRACLPSDSEWWLEADDAGSIELFSESGDMLTPDEVFGFTAFRYPDGRLAIRQLGEGGLMVLHDLQLKQSRWRRCVLTLEVGDTRAKQEFPARCFDLPRSGAYIFFLARDIYRSLGLSSCGDKSYKWVSKHFAIWSRMIEAWCGVGHFVSRKPQESDDLVVDMSECLDRAAFSSTAFLGLLGAWAANGVQQHGFRSDGDRRAASAVLAAALAWMVRVANDTLHLDVFLDAAADWKVWPRLPHGKHPCRMSVDSDGRVSVMPIFAAEVDRRTETARQRWTTDAGFTGDSQSLDLLGFVMKACAVSHRGEFHKSLWGQILSTLGSRWGMFSVASLWVAGPCLAGSANKHGLGSWLAALHRASHLQVYLGMFASPGRVLHSCLALRLADVELVFCLS